MVKIDTLLREGKVSKINEMEIRRYENFFLSSYKDNLDHCKSVIGSFPRWSIISGYYAMHDATKLLLAKKFRLKIELEVHATAIKAPGELIKNRSLLGLIERGHKEFIYIANDLAQAKNERVKVQYYTGTDFMRAEYRKRSREFVEDVVTPYLKKIERLTGD